LDGGSAANGEGLPPAWPLAYPITFGVLRKSFFWPHEEREENRMASNQIWLKKRKCNVHVGTSGRSVEL
jgi:hypothetical protein